MNDHLSLGARADGVCGTSHQFRLVYGLITVRWKARVTTFQLSLPLFAYMLTLRDVRSAALACRAFVCHPIECCSRQARCILLDVPDLIARTSSVRAC